MDTIVKTTNKTWYGIARLSHGKLIVVLMHKHSVTANAFLFLTNKTTSLRNHIPQTRIYQQWTCLPIFSQHISRIQIKKSVMIKFWVHEIACENTAQWTSISNCLPSRPIKKFTNAQSHRHKQKIMRSTSPFKVCRHSSLVRSSPNDPSTHPIPSPYNWPKNDCANRVLHMPFPSTAASWTNLVLIIKPIDQKILTTSLAWIDAPPLPHCKKKN